MSRNEYKKIDRNTVAWDLDAGCRNIIDQSTPARRHLKQRLRRQIRKKINYISFQREEIANDEN